MLRHTEVDRNRDPPMKTVLSFPMERLRTCAPNNWSGVFQKVVVDAYSQDQQMGCSRTHGEPSLQPVYSSSPHLRLVRLSLLPQYKQRNAATRKSAKCIALAHNRNLNTCQCGVRSIYVQLIGQQFAGSARSSWPAPSRHPHIL
jgi:hypothetical protein